MDSFIKIPDELKMTAMINAYCAINIPLLAFCTPRIVEMSATRSVVKIRLDRRTRNHLKVMYFGALAMGAELSIALRALKSIADSGQRIDFIFKDFQADFLKRADSHVEFVCEEAAQAQELIERAARSDERLQRKFSGFARTTRGEVVMKYQLTLSVRRRDKKSTAS